MALTNESFRDPRKLYRLRVKSSFYLPGQTEPAKVGEIVSLPRSLAAEVVHSNKAIWAEDLVPTPGVAPSPILRAQPPLPPEPEKTPDAKASSKKGAIDQ